MQSREQLSNNQQLQQKIQQLQTSPQIDMSVPQPPAQQPSELPSSLQPQPQQPPLLLRQPSPLQQSRSQTIPSRTATHHPTGSLGLLNNYIDRNLLAMQSIVNDFKTDNELYTIMPAERLFEVMAHLLAIEPIEVVVEGEDLLTREDRVNEWFGKWRQGRDRKGAQSGVLLSEILEFIRWVVREYDGEVIQRTRTTDIAEMDVKSQLIQTRKRYQKLLQNKKLSQSERRTLISMLNNIRQQISQLSPQPAQILPTQTTPKSQSQSPQPHFSLTLKNCLQIIFQYYCKQSYTAGKNPTFDRILHQNNVLSISKFMMFCRDFQLVIRPQVKDQSQSHHKLKAAELIEIFKKNSRNYREMNYEQFNMALKRIAVSGYKESGAEQRLYEHMEIESQGRFRDKLKKLRIPFTFKDRKERVPLPSGYKFRFFAHGGRLPDQVKETVIERTRSKEEEKQGNKISKIDSGILASTKTRSITQKPEASHKSRSPQPHFLLPPPPPPSLASRLLYRKHPTTNQPSAQALYINHNYIKLVQEGLHLGQSNRISSYQTSVNNNTGYSQIYKKKTPGKGKREQREQQHREFKLSDVVAEARDMMGSSKQETKQTGFRGQLASLIQDDGEEDDFLKRHYQLEQQSKDTISSKLSKRMDYYYQSADRNQTQPLYGSSQPNRVRITKHQRH